MPPAAVTDVAEDTDVVLPELLLPPLDELLLHPAAKTRLPIVAVAAIAYFPRKIPSRAQAFWRPKAVDPG
jgi:hypothetical protein